MNISNMSSTEVHYSILHPEKYLETIKSLQYEPFKSQTLNNPTRCIQNGIMFRSLIARSHVTLSNWHVRKVHGVIESTPDNGSLKPHEKCKFWDLFI